jgi:hypothetical protein
MKSLATLALLLASFSLVAGATPRLDGATIVNSGSTNTAGWTIAFRSDGRGTVTDGSSPSFSVSREIAMRFFSDVATARNGHAAGRLCMKSASFGTRLNVTWHGWTSPDLSCPSASTSLAALSEDVAHITAAASPPSGGMRRFIPPAPRRLPEQTPPPRR